MRYAFVPYWYLADISVAFIVFCIVYHSLECKSSKGKLHTAVILIGLICFLMYLNMRGIVANSYNSYVSFFTMVPNILNFAVLLLIGNILQEYKAFDLASHSKKRVWIILIVCMVIIAVLLTTYDSHYQYALQYMKWGDFGINSVWLMIISGLALTYSLICLCYYLKRFDTIRKGLSYLGRNTLDIMLLHFGIGELICMAFGFWYSIYNIPVYPAKGFALWHFYLVTVLTALIIGLYLLSSD